MSTTEFSAREHGAWEGECFACWDGHIWLGALSVDPDTGDECETFEKIACRICNGGGR